MANIFEPLNRKPPPVAAGNSAGAAVAAPGDPNTGDATRPKSAEMTPGPGFRVRIHFERPPRALIDRYRQFHSTDISDMLNRMYTMDPRLHNLTNDKPLVGPALTVKVFPGDNLMVHKALDVAQPGDVVVVDTSHSHGNAVFGDLIANKAKHRGIAGFIIDGLIRDHAGVVEAGLPVYACGVTPFGPLHRGPGELNYTVSCGGVVVNAGDIVVADDSGVVVIHRQFAESIADRLTVQRANLERYVSNVKRGIFNNDWVDAQLKRENCLFE